MKKHVEKNKEHRKLYLEAVEVCKNWGRAVEAAEICDDQGRKIDSINLYCTDKASREKVIKDVKSIEKLRAKGKDVQVPRELYVRAKTYFIGGLTEAKELAGVTVEKKELAR